MEDPAMGNIQWVYPAGELTKLEPDILKSVLVASHVPVDETL